MNLHHISESPRNIHVSLSAVVKTLMLLNTEWEK